VHSTSTPIALIGLGVMGEPIAAHLHARFSGVTGFDLSPEARTATRGRGVRVVDDLTECLTGADVVFTILPSVAASRQVLQAALRHASPGATLVELGTIGSEAACEHAAMAAKAGFLYLDAPVINGGQPAAEAATLKILAGGEAAVLQPMEPLFRAFSTDTFHMGPVGTGQTMKLLHNMLLGSIACASAEALALAERAGIGAQRAFHILRQSSTQSFALDWLFPAAMQNDFSGGAKVDILVKDLHLGEQEVARHQARAPYAQTTGALFDACQAKGWGRSDMSIVLKLLSENNEENAP
jgi:3-hydroxyisobutyrate dehydrogenase